MRSRHILIFIAAVIAVLGTLTLVVPEEGIRIGSFTLHYPSLHSIVAQREQDEPDMTVGDTVPVLDKMQDSIDYYRRQLDSSDLRFWMPSPHYLDDFWAAAGKARSQKRTLRVLHYGDSQIEMDHMTGRVRSKLQSLFGGGGPGMLHFQTVTPTLAVRQSNRGDLVHLATFGDSLAQRSKGNYGPMMQSFRLEGGTATATVKPATNRHVDAGNRRFERVRLVANNRGSLSASMGPAKGKRQPSSQKARQKGVVVIEWPPDSLPDGVNVQVSGTADLYALIIDADSGGVAVDNIPMRGCSGQQFTSVSKELLTAAYDSLDIGLIIMQFGGNSVPYLKNSNQVSTYCRSLGKQIDHVHECCPQAKILFIGPSDMSTRLGGKMQTYPIIPELIDSLIVMATAHDAAYWSIYHAMGGLNTMPLWSKQGLAGKDYIHFSQKGADLMGDRLAEALTNSHNLYQLEQRLEQQRKAAAQEKKVKKKSRKRRKGGRR